MEVLAGFLFGYLLGSEADRHSVSVMKDALGSVAGAGDIQSMISGGLSRAQGLFGEMFGDGNTVKTAITDIAASGEIKGLVSVGMSTAQGVAVDLFGRGKELVSQQRGRMLRLVV